MKMIAFCIFFISCILCIHQSEAKISRNSNLKLADTKSDREPKNKGLIDAGLDLPNSLKILRNQTVLRRAPTAKAWRRGEAMKGALLPILAVSKGFGCKDNWYQVYVDAWVCGSAVRVSMEPATGERFPIIKDGELTPWAYGFVREPSIEYRFRGGDILEVREVQKGFGFGVQGIVRISEQRFFKTAEGTLIPKGVAGISGNISSFGGIALRNGKPWPVGFVISQNAWTYSGPGRKKTARISMIERYSVVEALEEKKKKKSRFYRINDDVWIPASDVRVSREARIPKSVKEEEKWIDVDTRLQLLTAYEGNHPVYVTLVSTGRIGASATVKGEFRIWAKVAAIAMDNTDEELEPEEVLDAGIVLEPHHLYSLHDVPWVQFFHESYALHAVYWHNGFGHRRSHGCVNLSPKDARWLYNWTKPELPDGWWAIHATDNDKGTLVRIR